MISFARSSQTKADAGPREVGWQGSCECLHGSRSRELSGRTRVGSRLRGPLTFGPQPRGDGAHLVVPEHGSGVWGLGAGGATGSWISDDYLGAPAPQQGPGHGPGRGSWVLGLCGALGTT